MSEECPKRKAWKACMEASEAYEDAYRKSREAWDALRETKCTCGECEQ